MIVKIFIVAISIVFLKRIVKEYHLRKNCTKRIKAIVVSKSIEKGYTKTIYSNDSDNPRPLTTVTKCDAYLLEVEYGDLKEYLYSESLYRKYDVGDEIELYIFESEFMREIKFM